MQLPPTTVTVLSAICCGGITADFKLNWRRSGATRMPARFPAKNHSSCRQAGPLKLPGVGRLSTRHLKSDSQNARKADISAAT
jgi:hypothetical protein